MTEKLIIKNFGPIREAEIDLRKILVLIGPQSTGKSTIAKLVTILRSVEFVLEEKTFSELLEDFNIGSYLREDSFVEYVCEYYSFVLKKGKALTAQNDEFKKLTTDLKDAAKEGELTLGEIAETEKEISELEKLYKRRSNKNSVRKKLKKMRKEIGEISQRGVSANKELQKTYLSQIQKYINYSLYIPAERALIPIISNITLNLIQNKVPLPKLLLDYGAVFEQARAYLKQQDIDFLNVDYRFEDNQNKLYFEENESILLSEASSGMQSIIPLILVILYKSQETNAGNTYVIEEPELNLFPETQYALTKLIVEKCCAFDSAAESCNELIITTHSPYILTAFNNFLLAGKIAESKTATDKAQDVIPKKSWVAASDFSAYYVNEGGVGVVFDRESGLISENLSDSASEEIMGDFDALTDIHAKNISHA